MKQLSGVKIKKAYELELSRSSYILLDRLAKQKKTSINIVICSLLESNLSIFSYKKRDRGEYMQDYYMEKSVKKIIFGFILILCVVRDRVQDRIDETFRKEDEQLNKIKYAFCQNNSCPKLNKKYVAGTGKPLDYKGLTLYFCSYKCGEDFKNAHS